MGTNEPWNFMRGPGLEWARDDGGQEIRTRDSPTRVAAAAVFGPRRALGSDCSAPAHGRMRGSLRLPVNTPAAKIARSSDEARTICMHEDLEPSMGVNGEGVPDECEGPDVDLEQCLSDGMLVPAAG